MSSLLENFPVPDGGIIASPNDVREYKLVTLENKLDVLLVSDKECEKSAASYAVGVGSMSDPSSVPGLAHFLEHMLFMGTEKFPQENAYQLYLSNHGGSSNAYTSQDHTVYYFDVSSDSLNGALEIFASFFTCPLFDANALDRERLAVDSEHEKNIQNDSWRSYQLSKVVADQSHPYAKFSTGNITTLKDDIESAGINLRDAVMDFYVKNYSSNNSKLVIYGKESIEELLDWARSLFSDVPNRELPPKSFPPNPYPREGYCGKMVCYKPVVDKKNLSFTFPLPSVLNRSRNPPQRLLAHLIGHESKGSLLETLKANNYANALAAYCELNQADFALFKISVDLTDHGTNYVSDIVAIVFSYIGMLRGGIPVSVSEEIKKLEFIDFLYTEKIDPSNYVTNVVSAMLKYEKDPLLLFLPAVLELDTDYACQLLTDYFVPSNCIIFYKNQKLFEGDLSTSGDVTNSETYYKILYYERFFNEADLKLWEDCVAGTNTTYRASLHLPEPNPYIPSDFELCCKTPSVGVTAPLGVGQHPILLQRCANGVKFDDSVQQATAEVTSTNSFFKIPMSKSFSTWFKMDTTWKVPKVVLNCVIISPECSFSPLNSVLTELLCEFIDEKLNLDTYYAPIAGLNYSISASSQLNTQRSQVFSGIQVDVYGFSHKAIALMEKILSEFRKFANEFGNQKLNASAVESDRAIHRRILKKLQIKYNASLFNGGIQINRRNIGLIMQEGQYSILDVLDVVGYKSNKAKDEEEAIPLGLTFEDLQAFAARLFRLGAISADHGTANRSGDTESLKAQSLVNPYVNTSGNFRMEFFMYGNATSDKAADASASLLRILSNDDSDFIGNAHRPVLSSAPSSAISSSPIVSTVNSPSSSTARSVAKIVSLSALLERPRRGVTIDLSNLSLSNRTVVTRTHVKYYNPDEKNSVLENVYLFGNGVDYKSSNNVELIKREATAELISQLGSEQFFDVLRSKEQLGYVCWFSVFRNLGRVGICTIIQSSHTSPPAINRRVELFLKSFYSETLSTMTPETFELFRKSTIDNLIEKPKNLVEEGYNVVSEIHNQQLLFNRKALLAEAVKGITLEEVMVMFNEKILNLKTRMKIAGYVYGKDFKFEDLNAHVESSNTLSASEPIEEREEFFEVEDPAYFKSLMSLAPFSGSNDVLFKAALDN